MIGRIKQWAKGHLNRVAELKVSPNNIQEFSFKNIYIFPSLFGLLFGFVILTISTGAINYQLNPAFLFLFLLVVLGIIALWETHYNLNGLVIQCLPIPDTELGQPAKVTLLLKSDAPKRFSLYFEFKGEEAIKVDEMTYQQESIIVPIETKKRGKFSLPPLKIYSYYPLGIFRVWSYAKFSTTYYVYPKPVDPGYWPEASIYLKKSASSTEQWGEDELYDLKSVENPWIQPGRIAWKISARGQGWFLKTMTNPSGECWLFRLQDMPKKEKERNLQYIAYWLIQAEQAGHLYGIDLRGECSEITRGEQHLKDCLRKLATY